MATPENVPTENPAEALGRALKRQAETTEQARAVSRELGAEREQTAEEGEQE